MLRTTGLRLSVLLGVVMLTAAAEGCAARSTGVARTGETDRSPTLNPFVHFEDGDLAFLGVDGRAAQYVTSEGIFPLGFCVANRTNTSFAFSRESFVLEDESRRRYSPATYREFASGYGRAETDVRLADSFLEMMRVRFSGYVFESWPLFPPRSASATVRDRIEVGRSQYTVGYLYFPLPEGGIHGKSLTLLVRAEELPETLVVNFGIR